MNRSMLVTPTSINVMAAVVTCSRPAEKDCLFLGDSAVRAIKEVLYVLVSLVNLDSNVARHLEDLPDFLPHLFRFIRQGPYSYRSSLVEQSACRGLFERIAPSATVTCRIWSTVDPPGMAC